MERMNQYQSTSLPDSQHNKPSNGKMASRGRATAARFWLLAAASLLVAAAAAARPGPGECTSALVSLWPCVDYMCRGEATAAAALGRCCSQLRSVARSRPRCLCAALGVDRTSALSLPVACNVQTPECGGGSVRAGSAHAGAAVF